MHFDAPVAPLSPRDIALSSAVRFDEGAPPPAGLSWRRGVTLHDEPEAAPAVRLAFEDGREHAVDGRVVIGSGDECDVRLDDAWLSGMHCVAWREGGRTLVRDLGSRNGTWLGGARVRSGELRPGVRLTVGKSVIRVVADGEVARAAGMIGMSPAIRELQRQIARVAPSAAAVLLLGESGSGKELAARAVHQQSRRRGAFVPVNCGAIPRELVESELFGHERGAFTGAVARRAGHFAEAEGGTLFLDEIGELPLELQPKLLRALESGRIRAVGGSGERHVDVRLVAATHQDLPAAIDRGRFRLDLYHRLSTLEVRVPALRERRGDIPLLARHLLDEIAVETGPRSLSPEALDVLSRQRWGGNVRELRNVLYRAALLGGAVLGVEDVAPGYRTTPPAELVARAPSLSPSAAAAGSAALGRGASDVERALIRDALRRTKGVRRAAAAALGMAKSTLCDKVKRYGLDDEDFTDGA